MKKIILFTMLLITATTSFSQQTNTSPNLTKQDYLKKSKHQKTAAWILLGGGLLSATLGTVQFNFAGSDGEVDNSNSTIFLVTGLAAIGTSIPLFIASSKNKKKAMSVSFRNNPSQQIQRGSFVYRSMPSLTFKIQL